MSTARFTVQIIFHSHLLDILHQTEYLGPLDELKTFIILTINDFGTYGKSIMSLPVIVHSKSPSDPGQLLSDEVVVDFPSMLDLVERIQSDFFGASSEPEKFETTYNSQVNVTSKQASEGVHVPLDLFVQSTCPICGGRGEIWEEMCGICVGTGSGGVFHSLNIEVPPGVKHGTCLTFKLQLPFAAESRFDVRVMIF